CVKQGYESESKCEPASKEKHCRHCEQNQRALPHVPLFGSLSLEKLDPGLHEGLEFVSNFREHLRKRSLSGHGAPSLASGRFPARPRLLLRPARFARGNRAQLARRVPAPADSGSALAGASPRSFPPPAAATLLRAPQPTGGAAGGGPWLMRAN